MKQLLTTLVLAALSLSLTTGCVAYSSKSNNGYATTFIAKGIGINIQTASSDTETPAIQVGAFSSTLTVYPISTNPMYAAPFFETALADNSANPFNLSLGETEGVGDVSANVSTNGFTGAKAIVPSVGLVK